MLYGTRGGLKVPFNGDLQGEFEELMGNEAFITAIEMRIQELGHMGHLIIAGKRATLEQYPGSSR